MSPGPVRYNSCALKEADIARFAAVAALMHLLSVQAGTLHHDNSIGPFLLCFYRLKIAFKQHAAGVKQPHAPWNGYHCRVGAVVWMVLPRLCVEQL